MDEDKYHNPAILYPREIAITHSITERPDFRGLVVVVISRKLAIKMAVS
jgi:hypothetical protein